MTFIGNLEAIVQLAFDRDCSGSYIDNADICIGRAPCLLKKGKQSPSKDVRADEARRQSHLIKTLRRIYMERALENMHV